MNSSKHLRSFVLPFLVSAFTIVAFFPVLHNGFVDWDDAAVLLNNPHYRGLGWTEISWMFTTLHMSLYRPITWVTFGLDYLLWGMNPAGYHFTSLLFHAVNAVLAYFIAVRLLSLGHDNRNAIRLVAAFAAMLFALHPLRVEAVAWSAARSEPVAACFVFLSLICYLSAVENSSRLTWMSAAVGFFALSLLSKASAVTFPIVLVAFDFYPLRRIKGPPHTWFRSNVLRIWLEKIPFFALSFAAALISVVAKEKGGALAESNPWGNLPLALYAIGVYLWKTIFPVNLSPIYPVPDAGEIWHWPLIIFPVVVLVITIAVIIFRHRWPATAMAWFCYVALLLPYSGIVKYGPQLVADRYTYLPGLVLAVFAGAVGLYVWERLPQMFSLPASAGLVLVVTLLAFLTWRQTHVWHDSETLFRRAVAVAPRSIVSHHNLAAVLAADSRTGEAVEEYRRALTIRDYPDGHVALADLLSRESKFAEAMYHDREAIRLDPSLLPPRQHLALLLIREQRLNEAIEQYLETLKIEPAFAEGHNNLGLILASSGRLDDAIAHYREAITLKPDFALAYANLGDALAAQGKIDEAVVQLRKALEIDPNLAAAQRSLDSALNAKQRLK